MDSFWTCDLCYIKNRNTVICIFCGWIKQIGPYLIPYHSQTRYVKLPTYSPIPFFSDFDQIPASQIFVPESKVTVTIPISAVPLSSPLLSSTTSTTSTTNISSTPNTTETWTCCNCSQKRSGFFCGNCGIKKNSWKCSCLQINKSDVAYCCSCRKERYPHFQSYQSSSYSKSDQPWSCSFCGTQNQYYTDNCFKCRKDK
jgi:hypothetical protein